VIFISLSHRPCGKKKGGIDVDPLSVIFLFFFVLVLGIQALGMIVHRLGTFWHIMASTKMRPKKQGDRLLYIYKSTVYFMVNFYKLFVLLYNTMHCNVM